MEHFRLIAFIVLVLAASLLSLVITSEIGPDTPARKVTSKWFLGLLALLLPVIALVLPSMINNFIKLLEP